MKLKLSEHLSQKLVEIPESGMKRRGTAGYHNVRVKFADGSFLNTVVFNGDLLELPDAAIYIQEIEEIVTR